MNDETVSEAASAAELSAASLVGKEIYFPEGLAGFPDDQRFGFSRFNPGDGSESPFFLIDSVHSALSFALIHPDRLAVNFQLPVFPELLDFLHAANGADQLVPLLIVTVRDSVNDITVNLQGPLVVNPIALLGIQIVIENYPLRHSMLSSSAPEL